MYDIDGHKDLARDPKTGSILNVNDHDYEHYVSSRSAKKAKRDQTENMEQDLANLKSEMNEIKSLLKELVHGN